MGTGVEEDEDIDSRGPEINLAPQAPVFADPAAMALCK